MDVSGAEVGNLLEVARGCGRYPRLRFVLAADHVDFPLRGGLASDLMSGLSGLGPSGWPSNTLLYMAATPASSVSYDSVVSRFGLILSTAEMSEAQFASTLHEVASDVAGEEVPESEVPRALEWARMHGGLTVRAAAQYVRKAVVAAAQPGAR